MLFRKLFLFIFQLLILLSSVAAQSVDVSGNISDENDSPLNGATIFLHELNKFTSTDHEGNFEFKNINKGTYHLHITHVGYKALYHTFKVENQGVNIYLKMKKSSLEMDEFIIESDALKIDQEEKSLQIELMDRKTIDKFSTTSFTNNLERIPGVKSVNVGGGISKPMIRGLSFNRILVIENGIRQEGQQWGADHGLEIDQFNVDQVEIIKGPYGIIYGSDATAGVVNIRKKNPPKQNSLKGEITGMARTNNDMIGGSVALEGAFDDFFFRMRHSRQDYGAYKVPAESFVYGTYRLPIYDNRLKNTGGNESNFSADFGINKSWGNTQITATHFDQTAGLFAGSFSHPGTYSLVHDSGYRHVGMPRQETQHTKIISNTTLLVGKNWLEVDLGYQYNNRKELGEPHTHGGKPLPDSFLHMHFMLSTLSSNARYHIKHNDKWQSTVGVTSNKQFNSVGGFDFFMPKYEQFDAGVFLFEKFKLKENITLNTGIRFDYGNINYEGKNDFRYNYRGEITEEVTLVDANERHFQNFTGTAGVSYFPLEGLNLKLNFANHFRMPRANELAANGLHHGNFRHEMGEPNLKPERGYQLDFILNYSKENFIFKFTPFYSHFSNYIYLSPSYRFSSLPGGGQIFQYIQNPVERWGGEIFTEVHILKNLHLALGGDYVRATNLSTTLPLPFTPPASLFSEVEYVFENVGKLLKDFYININMRVVDNQNFVDRNEQTTPGYQLYNAAFGFVLNNEKLPVEFYFQVNNIMDKFYFNHLNRYRWINIPEAGRNFSISTKIPLNFK